MSLFQLDDSLDNFVDRLRLNAVVHNNELAILRELARAQLALKAVEGITTDQLRLMNATGAGTLATAYDVCSELRETLGDNAELRQMYEDNPIEWGLEVSGEVLKLEDRINQVVAWALNDPDATDVLHPMETAS